ncbi:MAG TPA: iron-sulfur cluster assembly protein [Candidatus Thermoplasmatota archaeon]|nr:iron-sulfur cluster assembly protein [Candidatus Thermoplasmatota archaeon]
MVEKETVIEALKGCYDPEIPVNMVDLGLVYDLAIEGDKVKIKMTLTSVACPAAGLFQQQVENAVLSVPGVKQAEVEIVHDPPWDPSKITEVGKSELMILGFNIPTYG